MKSLSKELFIMALLIMIVVFMVGIIFYEYMPNNKTVPEPITYSTASTTTAVLQEIADSVTDSSSSDNIGTESIIKSYSIGTKELSTAASKQSYTSGKTDPFADYTGTSNTTNGNTTGTNTTTNTTQGNTSNSGSTGTFFEKSNSK